MTHRLSQVSLAKLAIALVMALALWSLASPALAHDRLISADPEDGTELLQGEASGLTLTFSSEPLELGNTVTVTDGAGNVVFDGEPTIEGMDAIVEFESVPSPGEMTAAWRVVSSDGHPIEGTLTYTVTEDPASPAAEESAAESESATAEPESTTDESEAATTAEGSAEGEQASAEPAGDEELDEVSPAAGDEAAANSSEEGVNWWMWLPLLLLGLLAVIAGWFLDRKNKRQRAAESD